MPATAKIRTVSFIESPFPTKAEYDAWLTMPEAQQSAALAQRAAPTQGRASPTKQKLVLDMALFEYLTTFEATNYRRAYRNHRLGGAAGARGEAPKENQNDSVETSIEASLLGADDQATDEDGLVFGHIFGQGEMYGSEHEFRALGVWRLSYQLHRSGQGKGAKGEIGAGLSIEQVRRLPVARESEYLRAKCKREQRELQAPAVQRQLSPAAAAMKAFHIHVGAGRLGLGLVVPALALGSKANGGSLVLLQRPSKAWDDLKAGSVARFTVRQELVCNLLVVRDAPVGGLGEIQRNAADADADGLLVLSERPSLMDALARIATSLSCSLGPALESGLTPLLSALSRVKTCGGRIRLYAGENDHDAVSKLAATPQVQSAGLQVIPLLVDRVCTDRTITEQGVDTAAEPWGGEVVVMTPTDAEEDASDAEATDGGVSTDDEEGLQAHFRRMKALPPFAGDSVRWPSSAAEAHFLHRRKILTVNGTHTTLAFLALAQHEPPPHTGLPKGSHPLPRALPAAATAELSDAEAEEELQVEENERMVWSWVVARQLLLLFESSVEVACAALGCERDTEAETHQALADALLAGARVAVERLGTGADSTGRVLGGGVVNRYQTRLKPIASFIEGDAGSKWVRGKLPKLLLRRAKLTETAMRLSVLGLARDAERFTAVTEDSSAPTPQPTPKPSPLPTPKGTPTKTTKASTEAGEQQQAADAEGATGTARRQLAEFFPSDTVTTLLGFHARIGRGGA